MKNAKSETRASPDGQRHPRIAPQLPAVHMPRTLRYRTFEGAAGLEAIAFDYEPQANAESGKLVGERILGFMTEPVN